MLMNSSQCRAARGLLSWSQEQLAKNASVSRATVTDFEAGLRTPMKNNLVAMEDSMSAAGVEFLPSTDETGVGVRFRRVMIEYDRSSLRFSDSREGVVLNLRYGDKQFRCVVSYEAIDDFLGDKNHADKEEMSQAVSAMLPSILNVAERVAQKGIDGDEVVLKTRMFNQVRR